MTSTNVESSPEKFLAFSFNTFTTRHRQKFFQTFKTFKIPLFLGRPRVAFFADIMKIVTMLIKTIFKDSKNV